MSSRPQKMSSMQPQLVRNPYKFSQREREPSPPFFYPTKSFSQKGLSQNYHREDFNFLRLDGAWETVFFFGCIPT